MPSRRRRAANLRREARRGRSPGSRRLAEGGRQHAGTRPSFGRVVDMCRDLGHLWNIVTACIGVYIYNIHLYLFMYSYSYNNYMIHIHVHIFHHFCCIWSVMCASRFPRVFAHLCMCTKLEPIITMLEKSSS